MQKIPRTFPNASYDNPSLLSRVEEYFTRMDFAAGYFNWNYKKILFQQIISKLHYPLEVDDTPIHFTISCANLGGLGDFMFALKTIKSLEKYFPSSHKTFEYSTEKGNLPFKDYFEKGGFTVYKADQLLPPDQIEEDKTLSIFIEVGTPGDAVDNPDRKIVYRIDEYNGWRCKEAYSNLASYDYKKRGWHSAGIGNLSFNLPPVGIHIDTPRQQSSQIDALHNSQLKKDLESILAKNPESRIFFGYNSDGGGRFDYLHRFIRAVMLADKTSDSFCFVIRSTNKHSDPISKSFINKLPNTRKIRVINYEDKLIVTAKKTKSSKGPLVTFILTDRLDPQDMIAMYNISEGPTLLTGDQSFAEIISMNDKILFYQVQHWKRSLIEQFTKTATYLFGPSGTIVSFLNASTKYYDDEDQEDRIINTMTRCLEKNDLQGQFNTLFEYLRSYYNIEHWLIGDIKKQIIRKRYRQLAKVEKLQYKSSDSITHKMQKIMEATCSVLGKRSFPPKNLTGRVQKRVKIIKSD